MVSHVYKGIPIQHNGVIVAVQPVRSIVADNGTHYHGVLAQDARGNDFVYNQYPNTGVQPVVYNRWDDDNIWDDAKIWRDYEVI